ncbi:MAG: hypothetical protein HY842_16730 [Bacteroidetes bacterium]|nr:hypothetical protein [Bacteroidota bacterium]
MELTCIQHFWRGQVDTATLDSSEEICGRFAKLVLESQSLASPPGRRGLYVATSNAGAPPSVRFWAGVVEHGPAFALPKNFPWTLANAPCSYFARTLNIQGPNYTLVGKGNATMAAIEHAMDDLTEDEVTEALIIGIDFGFSKGFPSRFAGFLLTRKPSEFPLLIRELTSIDSYEELQPSDFLINFLTKAH